MAPSAINSKGVGICDGQRRHFLVALSKKVVTNMTETFQRLKNMSFCASFLDARQTSSLICCQVAVTAEMTEPLVAISVISV